MNKTILQIPLDKDTRDQATLVATQMGFSSLQEPIRLFIKQLARKKLEVKIEPKAVQLSPKAIKRYNKMTKDIESGKTKLFTANSVEELMDHFNNL